MTLLNLTHCLTPLRKYPFLACRNLAIGKGRTWVNSRRSGCALARALVPKRQAMGQEFNKGMHLFCLPRSQKVG